MATQSLDFSKYKKIVVLTGAGVSVASGLPAYRGPGGLWENGDGAGKYAMAETWRADPLGVWKVFGQMREAVRKAEPNPSHEALAKLQASLPETTQFFLVTQNVDGLHQAAGSEKVIELHGSLHRSRCSNDRCVRSPFPDKQTKFDRVPVCDICGELIRPDITLFGEAIGWNAERRSRDAVKDCDLFIAVGTSGTVTPASLFVRGANYEGAHTILVNLEPMDPPNPYFDREILGRAEELLPALLRV